MLVDGFIWGTNSPRKPWVKGSSLTSLQISAERVAVREGPSLGAAAITSLRRGTAKGNWRKFVQETEGVDPLTKIFL